MLILQIAIATCLFAECSLKCPVYCTCYAKFTELTCFRPQSILPLIFPNKTVSLTLVSREFDDNNIPKFISLVKSKVKRLRLDHTKLQIINADLFSGLDNLEELSLIGLVHLETIDSQAFRHLRRLRNLKIYITIGFTVNEIIHKVIGSIPSRRLDSVIISLVTDGFEMRQIVPRASWVKFRNKQLKILIITGSFIGHLNMDFRYLSNLSCLVLRKNRLHRAKLIPEFPLDNLRLVDLSHQLMERIEFSMDDANRFITSKYDNLCSEPNLDYDEIKELNQNTVKKYGGSKLCNNYAINGSTNLPINLRYAMMGDYPQPIFVSPNCFNTSNRLRYLDYSNTELHFNGPLRGLLRLQYLNLKNTKMQSIKFDVFGYFPSLRTLLLGGNRLANFFSTGNATLALQSSENLTTIDLSKNNITNISKADLSYLMDIPNVNLSHNNIESHVLNRDIDIRSRKIDLSYNKLHLLPHSFRKSLDKIAKTRGIFPSINVTNNPFVCDCKAINFTKWFLRQSHIFNNVSQYKCFMQGVLVFISEVNIDKLIEICSISDSAVVSESSHVRLTIGLVCGITFLVVTIGVLFRNRDKVKYFVFFQLYIQWHKIVYHMTREVNYVTLRNDNEYDVFVMILDSVMEYLPINPENKRNIDYVMDRLSNEFENKFKLSLAPENFGCVKSSYISAIEKCHCALLVASKDFLSNPWCDFVITMNLVLKRKIVLLCIGKPEGIKPSLGVTYLQRHNNIVYLKDLEDINNSIDKLERTLKRYIPREVE